MSTTKSQYKVASRPNRLTRVARQLLHRTIHARQPRVLCNSFQKSGTHLLTGLVCGLPGLQQYNRKAYWHYPYRCWADAAKNPVIDREINKLRGCLPGEVCRGHIAADPSVRRFLREANFKHLFMYRDPRDVVVSLLHWWNKHDEIDIWPFRYFRSLPHDDAKLRFLIEGWPSDLQQGDFPPQVAYPDLGTRYAEFMPWLTESACVAISFESLIDPATQHQQYERIAQHLVGRSNAKLIDGMIVGADPSRSRTFRKGQSGRWREQLSDDHLMMIKRVAGQTLITLGYERDLNW